MGSAVPLHGQVTQLTLGLAFQPVSPAPVSYVESKLIPEVS